MVVDLKARAIEVFHSIKVKAIKRSRGTRLENWDFYEYNRKFHISVTTILPPK